MYKLYLISKESNQEYYLKDYATIEDLKKAVDKTKNDPASFTIKIVDTTKNNQEHLFHDLQSIKNYVNDIINSNKNYIVDKTTNSTHYLIKNCTSGLVVKVAKSCNNLESIIKMVGQNNIRDII